MSERDEAKAKPVLKDRLVTGIAVLAFAGLAVYWAGQADGSASQAARVEVPGYEGLAKRGPGITDVGPDYLRACENGVVHVTLNTRGQLNQNDIYLPRHAIHILAGSKDRPYPMSITIKPDCLAMEEMQACRESDELFGFGAGIAEGAVNMERMVTETNWNMALVESDFNGLRAYRFSPELVEERLAAGEFVIGYAESLYRRKSNSEAFVNFDRDVDPSVVATLHVLCRYPKSNPPRPCMWRVVSPHGTVASQATPREALADWKPFFDRAVTIMDAVSEDGQFRDAC